jgi:DinB family protein
MTFDLDKHIEVLERTPAVLEAWLTGLSDDWITGTEGANTWSPYDVVGHLLHGEHTDWMPRLDIILSDREDRRFTPFDRFAQFRDSEGKSIVDLLSEFRDARAANLARLRSLRLTDTDLDRTGIHPKFGPVTARQLLATWAAHDLDHLMQISRVLAHQIGNQVGPWVEFLRVLSGKPST